MIARSLLSLCFCIALSSKAACSSQKMSLEEKVGQLFTVCFKGDADSENAKVLINKIGVGGIVYYDWANDLTSPEKVLALSSGLQALVKSGHPPLLIAADQEGGLVARLREGFISFPGNKALAMTYDNTLARQAAFIMGKELQAVGINFNLSPVVDVNSNPRNPVIGIRSFGDTKEVVVDFAEKALEGYHKAGILTSIKHFPGHGDVEIDSHEALPVLHKTKEELQEVELFPFKQLAEKTDTVMTAHIMIPSIDSKRCATLSKPILDVLRKDIGFKGVIISDSLTMEGVLQNGASYEDIAVKALNAGCDILLFGGKKLAGTTEHTEVSPQEIQKIKDAIILAVKEGVISEERIDEAVDRVLLLKRKVSLPEQKKTEELQRIINTPDSQKLAVKIARLALKMTDNQNLTSLQDKKITVIAPHLLKKTLTQTSFLSISQKTETFFFSGLNPKEEEIKRALELVSESDGVMFCSYNAHKNKSQAKLITLLTEQKKPFIFLIARDSEDEKLHPAADIILKTFDPGVVSLEAAVQKLLYRDAP